MPTRDTSRKSLKIVHAFADYGTESEVLSSFGTVHRYTIDPKPNLAVDETVQMDLMEEIPSETFDLGLFHPTCADKADVTSISGDPADHENQIPRAREIAKRIADDYIIENKPRDDLRDPTQLNGFMFGLPIRYERAFETSFPVRQTLRERDLGEKTVSPYFYQDRSHGWWAAVKGYSNDYPKEHLTKNALPSVYVQHLMRSYFEARLDRDAKVPQDNNDPAPRNIPANQAKLDVTDTQDPQPPVE